ncbi:argininosuccinate lyase [Stenotrophomonas sp. S41]|uniref:argininosuccinate lyase n=1 Tax=Stenotrophomonas sp. S41 TaxID=2767464 RepID=UPI00190E277B|nr:argininosuccinate lyase [Stenotrophomonas sp. S41]MBK0010788.1 argininosuccinate lyase [Stenotrophomonas sp. S41]
MKKKRLPIAIALTVGCVASLIVAGASAQGTTVSKDATRIGRSAVPKAAEFQELYDFDAAAKTLPDATFPYEARLHRAHVIMLSKQGIITRQEAGQILKGLDAVDRASETDAGLRTYLPYEAALIREIGPVAGKMHTGRSRNDLANAVNRMYYRHQVNRILEALIALRWTLVKKAEENTDTVMVVYTHRKEAQPITLAHYLMGISESLGKSIQRYEELYVRMNQNPLGSAAAAGTSWPLNRERTADLLGFEGLVVNTVEGTAGWDHIAELASDNAIYLSGLGRLASEIQLWSTDEYRSAELDGAFAGTSSIMPQKKNPDSLERTRQIAANSVGSLTSVLTSLNAIEYQHSVARVPLEPRSIDALIAATHAMTGVVRTLHPNKPQMLKYAAENYSTMTDLADLLVKQGNIDFREAHEIIASVVVKALDAGLRADQITAPMIEEAAKANLGHSLKLTAQQVSDALDPVKSVERRNGTGGPGKTAVAQMIASTKKEIDGSSRRLAERQAKLSQSSTRLDEQVANLLRP